MIIDRPCCALYSARNRPDMFSFTLSFTIENEEEDDSYLVDGVCGVATGDTIATICYEE